MSEISGRAGGPRDDDREAGTAALGKPTPEAARWLRRHLATAVGAMTTQVGDAYRAATVAGAMIASIDPLLVLVSLEAEGQMVDWVRDSRTFGLSMLGYRQQILADRFAGLAPLASARLEGVPHHIEVTGAPVLDDAIAWADCRVEDEIATGDHIAFIGRVVAVGRGRDADGDPLVYYLSRYLRFR